MLFSDFADVSTSLDFLSQKFVHEQLHIVLLYLEESLPTTTMPSGSLETAKNLSGA